MEQFQNENKDSYPHYPLSLFNQLAIDTERKVWDKRNKQESSIFDSIYLDHGTSGRGNNWAHGFYDDSLISNAMEVYRKVVESQYQYGGCMLIHSLAGGTGSGLGSRLIQEIRQEYGKDAIMTSSFAPFSSGETAVQSYNSLLTLNILQK